MIGTTRRDILKLKLSRKIAEIIRESVDDIILTLDEDIVFYEQEVKDAPPKSNA